MCGRSPLHRRDKESSRPDQTHCSISTVEQRVFKNEFRREARGLSVFSPFPSPSPRPRLLLHHRAGSSSSSSSDHLLLLHFTASIVVYKHRHHPTRGRRDEAARRRLITFHPCGQRSVGFAAEHTPTAVHLYSLRPLVGRPLVFEPILNCVRPKVDDGASRPIPCGDAYFSFVLSFFPSFFSAYQNWILK